MRSAEGLWRGLLGDLGLSLLLALLCFGCAGALAAPPAGGCHSPALRAGLAAQLAQGQQQKPTHLHAELLAQIKPLLGGSAPPPEVLMQDLRFRAAYEAASQRFVSQLIASAGWPQFLLLCASQAPEAAYPWLYGSSREVLVDTVFPLTISASSTQ